MQAVSFVDFVEFTVIVCRFQQLKMTVMMISNDALKDKNNDLHMNILTVSVMMHRLIRKMQSMNTKIVSMILQKYG